MALIIKRAKSKSAARGRRHLRVRKKVHGTSLRPRLVVSRSSRHVFVQVVDDTAGARWPRPPRWKRTCVRSRVTRPPRPARSASCVAERAKSAGVDSVVFDRGGNRYHGRIAAIADGAREGGWLCDGHHRDQISEKRNV
jgi:large subunit ribosomal protein L18